MAENRAVTNHFCESFVDACSYKIFQIEKFLRDFVFSSIDREIAANSIEMSP